MSSPVSFEVLLAVSRQLEDDFIDEDIMLVEPAKGRGAETPSNRTITVRGRREGQALVLCYQDYYSTNSNPVAPAVYERNVLEVFVAQPKISFEGVCQRRGVLDKVARWFGGGGLRGPHPIFERMRLDQEEAGGSELFECAAFCDGLERIASAYDTKRVLLQAGSGLTAVTHWVAQGSSPEAVLALVDDIRAVTATLG
jgi:hypothetical protein